MSSKPLENNVGQAKKENIIPRKVSPTFINNRIVGNNVIFSPVKSFSRNVGNTKRRMS